MHQKSCSLRLPGQGLEGGRPLNKQYMVSMGVM